MKNITVTDEDYKILMDLSKELKTQENDHQAFPYFWEPSSTKREVNIHGEGEHTIVFYDGCETGTPKEYIEENEIMWLTFLKGYEYEKDVNYEDVEAEWIEFLNEQDDLAIWTEDDIVKQEHNPSLFKSDVKDFIKCNKHHLGGNPHTYSRTIWRMPKMESLVKAVLNLNKEHSEEINHEANRFIKTIK